MKEIGFMNFLEKYGLTRSYLKKFAAINAAIFVAEYVYAKKVVIPRNMEIEVRWYDGLSLEEQCEFLKKPSNEQSRILNEVDKLENAKSKWFRIF